MASIEKRSETTYRITVSTGYNNRGKKLRKHKTVTLPDTMTEKQREKEIQKQAALFEREVENGTYLDGEKITFGEFTEKWIIDYAEKQFGPKTLYENKKMLELRIIPALGHIKLSKLQPTHLLSFYNNLSENGMRLDYKYKMNDKYASLLESPEIVKILDRKTVIRLKDGNSTRKDTALKISNAAGIPFETLFSPVDKDKGLSKKTINNHHGLISSILTSAVQWQLLTSNPAERVKPPKKEKKEAKHYDDEQVALMLSLLNKEPLKYRTIIFLEIYSGVRIGELTALEWSDIDFEKGTIKVSKALQHIPHIETYQKDPKSHESKRAITIPDSLLELLKTHRTAQNEARLKCGELWKNTNKIFATWNGGCIYPYSPSAWFRKFIKKNNLPYITFHQLRHTNASLMIAEGVDVVTVSKRLGHAQTSTTMNIYSHLIKKAEREASDKLENLLNPKCADSSEISS